MKRQKRILSAILVIIFMLATYTSAFATGKKDDTMSYLSQTISSYLPILESDADAMGFKNVDFTNVKIGSEVNAFKICTTNIEPSEYRIFPLFSNNRIFAICNLVENNDGTRSVTVSKSYADSLNSINSDFAILFGNDAVYAILENGSYTKLQDSVPTYQLSALTFNDAVSTVAQFCTSISASQPVMYTTPSTRAINYNYLDVPFVSQNHKPICWAACMASVIEFHRGSSYSYTAENIVSYLGLEEEAQSMADMAEWLCDYWSIDTYVFYATLTFATTVQYIDNSIPLIVRLRTSSNEGHFVVVRGYYHDVNTSVYHVSYMEPNNPNAQMSLTTFNSSGGFSHTLDGSVYTQDRFMTTDYWF